MREHPGIGFKGGPAGRRAWVVGTGPDVWEMIEMYRSMGRETLLESMGNVSEAALKENALPPEHWHGLHPETIPPSSVVSPGD